MRGRPKSQEQWTNAIRKTNTEVYRDGKRNKNRGWTKFDTAKMYERGLFFPHRTSAAPKQEVMANLLYPLRTARTHEELKEKLNLIKPVVNLAFQKKQIKREELDAFLYKYVTSSDIKLHFLGAGNYMAINLYKKMFDEAERKAKLKAK